MKKYVNRIDWLETLGGCNIGSQWNLFKGFIDAGINNHDPKKFVSVNNIKRIPLKKEQVAFIKQKH